MSMHRAPNPMAPQAGRRGTLLVCVLVCVAVATAIVGSSLRQTLRHRRDTALSLQMRQTELMLEAGVIRAMHKLERDDDYEGETWHPEALENARSIAQVDISIKSSESGTERRRVEVEASIQPRPDDASPTAKSARIHVGRTQRSESIEISTAQTSSLSETQAAE